MAPVLIKLNTAEAKASGSAEVHFRGYTLFDLNPLDGIAPALTVGDSDSSSGLATVNDYAASLYISEFAQGGGTFAPLAVSAGTSNGAASAQLIGTGTFDRARIVVSGWG